MSTSPSTTTLRLPGGDALESLADAAERGYLSHVLVEVDGSSLYPVFFYTAARLQTELQIGAQHGDTYIAETGMIVLEELTLDAMKAAVQNMCDQGYFDYMVPLTEERIAQADPFAWPP